MASNLQSAIDTFEQYAKLRSGDLNERTIPEMAKARERWITLETPDTVQRMGEYQELRSNLLAAARAPGQEGHAEVNYADQAMREWAKAQGVNVEPYAADLLRREGVTLERPVHAQPGRSYAGPVVSLTDTHVVQQVDGQRIEHERRALVHGNIALTKEILGKSVEISYPHGKVGLVRDPEMVHRQEGPALRHEMGTR